MSIPKFAITQLRLVQSSIANAAKQYQRDPSSIQLIGASKTQSTSRILAFHQAGLNCVGENYLKEALDKQTKLQDHSIEWHFIGGIQSNKTSDIANRFRWVHSIDRLKIAQRLNAQCKQQSPLSVLIQLNVDLETSKSGIPIDQAAELCNEVAQLENLHLRGFMLIPKTTTTFDQQRRPFALARKTLTTINQQYGLDMDTLSMGMSNDLEAAIAEGSTIVRIGTSLFGARETGTRKT